MISQKWLTNDIVFSLIFSTEKYSFQLSIFVKTSIKYIKVQNYLIITVHIVYFKKGQLNSGMYKYIFTMLQIGTPFQAFRTVHFSGFY